MRTDAAGRAAAGADGAGDDAMRGLEDRIRAATRAAAREITADSIGPLRLQPRPLRSRWLAAADGQPGWARRAAWRQRAMPLAAAAAVLAVIAGVATVTAHPPAAFGAGQLTHAFPRFGPPAPAAAPHLTATARARQAPAAAPARQARVLRGGKLTALPAVSASAAIPAYYVALARTRKPFASSSYDAAVYSSTTGAELARIRPPGAFRSFVQVSAAADDRTFALAAQYGPAAPSPTTSAKLAPRQPAGTASPVLSPAPRHETTLDSTVPGPATTAAAWTSAPSRAASPPAAAGLARVAFFILRFNPAAGSTQLTVVPRLVVPARASFDALALSPDGKQLAVAFAPGGRAAGTSGEIQIGNIATGRVRTWSSPAGAVGGGTIYPGVLSWTADSRTLAFNWSGSSAARSRASPPVNRPADTAAATGLRLLDTSSPAGDVVARSKLALHWNGNTGAIASGGYLSNVALITPDGRGIVAVLDQPAARLPVPLSVGVLASFAEYASATGSLRYVLEYPATRLGETGGPAGVLWSNPAGSMLIVYAPTGDRQGSSRIGVLRGSVLTLLPQPATAQFPAAAW
jgi:hypothetical protein